MTSLGVALAVDSRGPSALYIITDSRITWHPGNGRWDTGQKTFASARTPDVFGFCGDAFFPPAALRQFLEQVHCGIALDSSMDARRRHALMLHGLQEAIDQQCGAPISSFSVFHGARDHEHMHSTFHLWETRMTVSDKTRSISWFDEERDIISDHSYFVHIDGTGGRYIKKRGRKWLHSDANGTSRAAIGSFCDALHEGLDPCSGGAPQLVGIWRKGPGRTFGFWWNGKAYLAGAPVPDGSNVAAVDWFNHRFERCDGGTGRRKEGAARHEKPNPVQR